MPHVPGHQPNPFDGVFESRFNPLSGTKTPPGTPEGGLGQFRGTGKAEFEKPILEAETEEESKKRESFSDRLDKVPVLSAVRAFNRGLAQTSVGRFLSRDLSSIADKKFEDFLGPGQHRARKRLIQSAAKFSSQSEDPETRKRTEGTPFSETEQERVFREAHEAGLGSKEIRAFDLAGNMMKEGAKIAVAVKLGGPISIAGGLAKLSPKMAEAGRNLLLRSPRVATFLQNAVKVAPEGAIFGLADEIDEHGEIKADTGTAFRVALTTAVVSTVGGGLGLAIAWKNGFRGLDPAMINKALQRINTRARVVADEEGVLVVRFPNGERAGVSDLIEGGHFKRNPDSPLHQDFPFRTPELAAEAEAKRQARLAVRVTPDQHPLATVQPPLTPEGVPIPQTTRIRPGADVGRVPKALPATPAEPSPVEPKVRRTFIDSNVYETVQQPGTGGVLLRNGEIVGVLPGDSPTLVVARQIKDEGKLLTQVEVAMKRLFKGEGPRVKLEAPLQRRVLGETDDHIRAGIARAKKDGGFTFNRDGSPFEGDGFVVSVASKNVASKDLTPKTVRQFADKHGESLTGRNLKVGLFDMGGGKYSVDLNVVMSSRNDAIKLGRRMNQKSIFDAGEGKVIETGGTGATRTPSATQLNKELDGLGEFATLEHFSSAPREVISPRFAGSGPIKGAERSRGGVPKTYFVLAGKTPEAGLGNYQHTVTGRFKLYDILRDPGGFLNKAKKALKEPTFTNKVVDAAEIDIKAAGFDGIKNSERNVVALFRDVRPDRVDRVDLVALRAERRLEATRVRADDAADAARGRIRTQGKGLLGLSEQGAATPPPGFRDPDLARSVTSDALAQQAQERVTRARIAEGIQEGMAGKGGRADQGLVAASRALGNHMTAFVGGKSIPAKVFRFYMQRATDMAKRDLGAPGREWTRRIEVVRVRALQRFGRLMEGGLDADGNPALGANQIMARYTDDQMIEAVRHNMGFIPDEMVSKEARAFGEEMRVVLDDIADAYKAAGGTRAGMPFEKSGKFFPQFTNKVGRDIVTEAQLNPTDPLVSRAAARMSEEMGMSEADASKILINYRKRQLIQNNGYLTEVRDPLPEFMVQTNPRIYMEDFLEKQSMWLEGNLEFGVDQVGAKKLFEAMRDIDPGLADALALHHHIQFGGRDATPEAVRQFFGAISNTMTITKLGHPFVTIKQVGQRIINTSDLPLSVVLKTYKEMPHDIFLKLLHSKKLRARKEALALEARQSGAVQTRFTAIQDIEEASPMQALIRGGIVEVPKLGPVTVKKGALDVFGFLPGEKGNQEFTAIVAKRSLEFLLKRHVELAARDGQATPLGKMFNAVQDLIRDGVIPVKGQGGAAGKVDRTLARIIGDEGHMASIVDRWSKLERITPEEFKAIMIKANQDRNFPLDIMTKPVKWDQNPIFRLALKFKPFIAKETAFLWKNVYKEAAKGNVGPFLRAFTAGTIMGEAYNIPRDLVMGRSGSLTVSLLKDPSSLDEAGEVALKLLSHQADAATMGLFSDLVWGWDNFAAGVVGSTAESFALAGRDLFARAGRPGFFKQLEAVSNEFLRDELPLYKQAEGFRNKVDSIFRDNNYHPEWSRVRDRAYAFDEEFENPGVTGQVRQFAQDALGARSEGFKRNENTLLYRYAWENIALGDTGDAAEYLEAVYKEKGIKEAEAGIMSSMRAAAPLGPLSTSKNWEANPKVGAFLDGLSIPEERRIIALQERFIDEAFDAIDEARRRAE